MLIPPPSCPHEFPSHSKLVPTNFYYFPPLTHTAEKEFDTILLGQPDNYLRMALFCHQKPQPHWWNSISSSAYYIYSRATHDVDWPHRMNKLLCSFFSRNLVHRDPMGWKVSCASWAKRRLLGYFPKLQVSIVSRRERESCPQSSFCSNLPWIRSQGSEDDMILRSITQ